MMHIREICALDDTLNLAGLKRIHFDYDRDVVFEQWKRMAAHPNGMRFQAFDAAASLVDEQVWYSIGGGFVRKGAPEDPMIGIRRTPPKAPPLPMQTSHHPLISASRHPTRSHHALNWCRYAGNIISASPNLYGPTKPLHARASRSDPILMPSGVLCAPVWTTDAPRRNPHCPVALTYPAARRKCIGVSPRIPMCCAATAGAKTPCSSLPTPHGWISSPWPSLRRMPEAGAS